MKGQNTRPNLMALARAAGLSAEEYARELLLETSFLLSELECFSVTGSTYLTPKEIVEQSRATADFLKLIAEGVITSNSEAVRTDA